MADPVENVAPQVSAEKGMGDRLAEFLIPPQEAPEWSIEREQVDKQPTVQSFPKTTSRTRPYEDTETIPGVTIVWPTGKPQEPKNEPSVNTPDAESTVMRAKPTPNVDTYQSFIGAANDAITYLPDAALNRIVRMTQIATGITPPEDPRQNKDFLQRIFMSSDYATKEKILGFIDIGIPGEVGQDAVRQPIAQAMGEGAGNAIQLGAGLAKLAAKNASIYLTRFAAEHPGMFASTESAVARAAAEKAAAAEAAATQVGGTFGAKPFLSKFGAPVEGLEAPINWSTKNLFFTDEIGRRALQPWRGFGENTIETVLNRAKAAGATMVEPFAAMPVMAQASNLVGNIAAEAASAYEKEFTPVRTSKDEGLVTGLPAVPAGIVGGFLPEMVVGALTQSPAQTLKQVFVNFPSVTYQVGKKLVTMSSDKLREMNAPEYVEQKVAQSLEKVYAAGLEQSAKRGDLGRTEELNQALVGAGLDPLDLTPAEAALDKYFKNMQLLTLRSAGEDEGFVRQNLARVTKNIDKAFQFARKMFPQNDDAPISVFGSTWKSAVESAKDITSLKGEVDNELDKILRLFPTRGEQLIDNEGKRISRSQQIQDHLVSLKESVKADLLKEQTRLKLDKPIKQSNFQGLKDDLADIFKLSYSTDAYVPKAVRDIRDMDGNRMNFLEYRRIRDDLGDQLSREFSAPNVNSSRVTALDTTKQMLDKWAAESFGVDYKAWAAKYQKEYVTPFENGLTYKLTALDPASRPGATVYALQGEMVADEIIQQTIKRGKITDFDKYLNIVQNSSDGGAIMGNLRSAVLDDILAKVAMRAENGRIADISQRRLAQYIDDNGAVLQRLGMKEEMADISSATDAVSQRVQQLRLREEAIKKDQLITVYEKEIASGRQTVEEYVDSLISDPKKMGQFWFRLNKPIDGIVDEPLKNAFKSSVFNRMIAKMDVEQGPDAFVDMVSKNAQSLKKIMTPKEIDDFTLVNDMIHRINFANANDEKVTLLGPSWIRDLEKQIGTPLQSLGSYYRGLEAGKQSPTFLSILVAKNFFIAQRRNAWEEITRRALVEPELVKVLATKVRPDGSVPPEAERKFRSLFFGALRGPAENFSDKDLSYDVTYDPQVKGFVRVDTGKPLNPKFNPVEEDKGLLNFPRNSNPVPVQIPSVQPVPVGRPMSYPSSSTSTGLPNFNTETRAPPPTPPAAPAPVSTPAPTQTMPPQPMPPAQQNQTPGKQGMIYQNMFPNDPLGSLLAAKRAG